jgi:2'-5' RNA ligase
VQTSPDPGDNDSGTASDDWESFRKLGQLVDHWDRPGWGPHTRSYHWFITFDSAADLEALTEKCQKQLRGLPHLDLVPPDLIHLTVKRVAFTDEIDVDEALAVAGAAAPRLAQISPIALKIGPLTGSTGAVRFSVAPNQPVVEVRAAVRAAAAEVLGSAEVPRLLPHFVPHVSIAYSNAVAAAEPIIERVQRLRSLAPAYVAVRRVELVELRREQSRYLWTRLADLRLGTLA